MQINHIQLQAILSGQPLAYLYILLGGAVPFRVLVGPYFDVEKMRVDALLFQHMDGNGRVNASRH
jgi:hypothetical protein